MTENLKDLHGLSQGGTKIMHHLVTKTVITLGSVIAGFHSGRKTTQHEACRPGTYHAR